MRNLIQRFRSMLSRRHNVRAHFWQTSGNYVQKVGSLVMSVVLARLLPPEVFGQLVLISSTLFVIFTFLNFSASQLLVSDAGRTLDLYARVMGVTWLTSLLKCLALVGYIIWALAMKEKESAVVAAFIGLPAILGDWLAVIRADLEGKGHFKPNFVVNFVGVTLHGLIAIFLALAGWGIYALAIAPMIAFLPKLIIYLRLSDHRLTEGRLNIEIFRNQFRQGFWLWLNFISTSLFSRIDNLFLGNAGGASQLGYYNRAFNYGPISHIVLNSLMTGASVRALAMQSNALSRKKIFGKTMLILISCGVGNGLFWSFSAPLVVPFIFGPQWQGAIPAFQWLGWIALAYSLSFGSATVLLANKDYQNLALQRIVALLALAAILSLVARTGYMDAQATAIACLSVLTISGLSITQRAMKLLNEEWSE